MVHTATAAAVTTAAKGRRCGQTVRRELTAALMMVRGCGGGRRNMVRMVVVVRREPGVRVN